MGNYSSTNTESFNSIVNRSDNSSASGGLRDNSSASGVLKDNDQESKILTPPQIYVVCNLNSGHNYPTYYYTDTLKKATDYVDDLIYTDISVNYGYHIRTEEVEYEDEIIYTLYRYDPTSLFCKYSFYCKYRILKVQSMPSLTGSVTETANKKTD